MPVTSWKAKTVVIGISMKCRVSESRSSWNAAFYDELTTRVYFNFVSRAFLLSVFFIIRSARNHKNKGNDQKRSAENADVSRDKRAQNSRSKKNSTSGSRKFGTLFNESRRCKKYWTYKVKSIKETRVLCDDRHFSPCIVNCLRHVKHCL